MNGFPNVRQWKESARRHCLYIEGRINCSSLLRVCLAGAYSAFCMFPRDKHIFCCLLVGSIAILIFDVHALPCPDSMCISLNLWPMSMLRMGRSVIRVEEPVCRKTTNFENPETSSCDLNATFQNQVARPRYPSAFDQLQDDALSIIPQSDGQIRFETNRIEGFAEGM